MIFGIIIGSHIPTAARFSRNHFGNELRSVVITRDDPELLIGIDKKTTVFILDSGVIRNFPNVFARVLDEGRLVILPKYCKEADEQLARGGGG